MPASILRTPVSETLILSRTIAARAVTIEVHDTAGTALYTEEIALTPAPAEPGDPEQAGPVL